MEGKQGPRSLVLVPIMFSLPANPQIWITATSPVPRRLRITEELLPDLVVFQLSIPEREFHNTLCDGILVSSLPFPFLCFCQNPSKPHSCPLGPQQGCHFLSQLKWTLSGVNTQLQHLACPLGLKGRGEEAFTLHVSLTLHLQADSLPPSFSRP